MIVADLNKYKKDSRFYPELPLFMTIKSFDLQAIRARYLKSKKSSTSRTGSVERREVATGGVAIANLKKGKVEAFQTLIKLPEPRGIDMQGEVLSFSSENVVYVLFDDKLHCIQDPWFSYIHTVNIKNERVLISSSGFDAIFEWDYKNLLKKYEWFAWENGFNHGVDPQTGKKFFLTRQRESAEYYKENEIPHLYIHDPKNQVLPTAKRAAFINSVVYDAVNYNNILATFFHEGAVFSIDRITSKATRVLDGLKNPHGGRRFMKSFMATSTASGEVVLGNLEHKTRIAFSNLPGKPDELAGMEWLQNSILIEDQLIVTIDSNRNAFVIIDINQQLYDILPFDKNLAIQDFVIGRLNASQQEIIRNIKQE